MKPYLHLPSRAALILAAIIATATPALSGTYYWDSTAPLSDFGFGTTSGTWGTDARWVTSRAGTDAAGISGTLITDHLNFGFESIPFSNGTIAVNGTQAAKSLSFARRQGSNASSNVTLSGGTITLAADAIITCSSSAITDTISSELAGAANSLTKVGAGVLALGGLISYTGDTIVNAGTLKIETTATGSLNSSKALFLNGGTFTYSKTADAGQTLNGLTIGSGTSTVNNTVAGKTLDLGAITRASGNGVLSFGTTTGSIVTSTANTTSGILGPWAMIGTTTNLRYAVANGASPITGLTGTTAIAGTLENITSPTTNYEFSGAATTVEDLVGNTLRSSGTGATTIAIGSENTLTLDGILNAGGTSSTLTISGGAATGGLLIGSSGELVIASNSRTSSPNSLVTISAVIAGTGGKLSFSSPPNTTWQFSLSGANTYTGGTFINNAQVFVNAAANLGTGPITFGGTEFMSQLRLAADVTWPQDMIVNNASLATFQGGFTATCNGNVSGDGGINAAGANGGAYVHLDGTNNTFRGPVIIGLYNTSTTFKYGVSVASFADSPTANGAIIIGGGSTVSSILGANGPYFAYTGNTALTLDHRQIKVATTTSTSAFVINNSANNSAMTINTDLRVATEVTGNKILALGGTSTGPSAFAGKIANSPTGQLISVNKLGTGTWQLTNTGNTYSGNTTVSAGTLAVTGAGSINASSGILINGATAAFMHNSSVANSRTFTLTQGTLGGTGTITTALAVGANATLAPGDRTLAVPAKGTLTVSNGVTLNAGSTTALRLFGSPSNDSDKLVQNTAGTITFNGTLNVSSSADWTPVAGRTYDLFDWIGTAAGTFASINLPALPGGLNWHDYGSGVLFDYSTGRIKIDGENSYTDWLAAYPPATGFQTDSDDDGIPNGVENVLGSNPNISSAGLIEVSSTAKSVVFKHQRNPAIASDVTYGYQWSTNLTEWKAHGQTNTSGTTATIAASVLDGSGVVTVTMTITSGPAANLFGRLVATQ